jgi:hypothetical protein
MRRVRWVMAMVIPFEVGKSGGGDLRTAGH